MRRQSAFAILLAVAVAILGNVLVQRQQAGDRAQECSAACAKQGLGWAIDPMGCFCGTDGRFSKRK